MRGDNRFQKISWQRYKIRLLMLICISLIGYGDIFSQKITISGFLKEESSKELLSTVNIYCAKYSVGTSSNNYGFYSLDLPISQDSIVISYSFVGYQKISKKILAFHSQEINIELPLRVELLESVTVKAENNFSDSPAQMGNISLSISRVKETPALMGEKDVLKVLQLMPGIQKGNDGSAALYVRGGGADQNLIILDDATVYNAFHLFGFVSVFNADALKKVELYKSGFPAQFGGRLSSVLNMQMREGNKEKIKGEGGIGLLSSRFMLEGPIQKDKSSFIVSARRSYGDLLAGLFVNSTNESYGYYFYDINAKANFEIGTKDKLFISTYLGKDKLKMYNVKNNNPWDFSIGWYNTTGTFRWNHLFSQKVFSNTSLSYSHYQFDLPINSQSNLSDGSSGNTFKYSSSIKDITFKTDFDFIVNPQNIIKTGLNVTLHDFNPNMIVSNNTKNDSPEIETLQSSFYLQDTYKPNDALAVEAGVRLATFRENGQLYSKLEPRLNISYLFGNEWSMKTSYSQMNQFVHLLSNSGIGLPTDIWIPTTAKIPPQQATQIALGLAKNWKESKLKISTEGFYKKMNNLLALKDGESFIIANPNGNRVGITYSTNDWQEKIISGQGWAYGGELFVQKDIGKFSGWLGYTLSWTKHQFAELNNNEVFYPTNDRRHDISIVGTYKPTAKITLSANWVYGTGRAVTLLESDYQGASHYPGVSLGQSTTQQIDSYSKRGFYRLPAYHRLDLGVQFHKIKAKGERTWEVGIYNAYNNFNPFFYYYVNNKTTYGGSKRSIGQLTLFTILPFVTYNFKF
jgi:hypothetical protein